MKLLWWLIAALSRRLGQVIIFPIGAILVVFCDPPLLAFIIEVTVFSLFKLTDTEKFLWISFIHIFPIKYKHCTMCQQVVYFHIYTILVICGKSWTNVTWPPKLAQCAVVGRCCRYCTQVFLANNLRVYSQLRAKHHRCNTIFHHNQLQPTSTQP